MVTADFCTSIPPDVVQFSPDSKFLATGMYELVDGKRIGFVYITRAEDLLEKRPVVVCLSEISESYPVSAGVLDLKWYEDKVLVACADGSINEIKIASREISIYKIFEDGDLVMQIDLKGDLLAACSSTGSVTVFDMSLKKIKSLKKFRKIETWAIKFTESGLLVGNDYGELIEYDSERVIFYERDVGICAIAEDENIFIGLLSGKLLEVEIKSLKITVLREINLLSGVWRIRVSERTIYIANMYDGYKLIDKMTFSLVRNVPAGLAYGIDFLKMRERAEQLHNATENGSLELAVGCSFYEKKVCLF